MRPGILPEKPNCGWIDRQKIAVTVTRAKGGNIYVVRLFYLPAPVSLACIAKQISAAGLPAGLMTKRHTRPLQSCSQRCGLRLPCCLTTGKAELAPCGSRWHRSGSGVTALQLPLQPSFERPMNGSIRSILPRLWQRITGQKLPRVKRCRTQPGPSSWRCGMRDRSFP